jgi:hypothetical protein
MRKTPLFAPLMYKNDRFTKTGSGQTPGKLTKEWRCLQKCVIIVSIVIANEMTGNIDDSHCDSVKGTRKD